METVSVIATTREGTRAALRAGSELAGRGACRVLLFVRAGEASGLPHLTDLGAASVFTYSGREEALIQLLPKSGPVVVGGCGGGFWRPTQEQQLAWKLTALGYRVIFAVSETSRSARATVWSLGSSSSSSGDT